MRLLFFVSSFLLVSQTLAATKKPTKGASPKKPTVAATKKTTAKVTITTPTATRASATGTKTRTSSLSSAVETSCASLDSSCSLCAYAIATIYACQDVISNYDDLIDTEGAKCLCYNPAFAASTSSSTSGVVGNATTVITAPVTGNTSLVFVPNQFDDPWNACIAWASTADPEGLPYYTPYQSFCATTGGVRSGVATDISPLQTDAYDYDSLVQYKEFAVVDVNVTATVEDDGTGTNMASVMGVPTWILSGLVGVVTLLLAAL